MRKCVVAIAKNEDRYMTEWLDHYKNIGFSKAIVFDNGLRPSLRKIVEKNGFSDFCEVDDRYVGVTTFSQLNAYKLAFETNKNKFDWFGFFDIDEFLSIDMGLDEFLSDGRYSKFDGIRLHWKIFTDNGLIRYDDRPVKVRFTEALPISFHENRQCKMLLKSSAHPGFFSCHGAQNVSLCDTRGNKCENVSPSNSGPVVWDYARLNHYRTKTIEEFMLCKYLRGDTWRNHSTTLHEFFSINKRTPEKMAFIETFTKSKNPLDRAADPSGKKFSTTE